MRWAVRVVGLVLVIAAAFAANARPASTFALRGLVFTPDPVAFPMMRAGANTRVTVKVRNEGTVPLVITGLSTRTPEFPIVSDRCGPAPFTLEPFASCEVGIAFVPASYGLHSGVLEVQSNLPGPARTVRFEAFGTVETRRD